LKILIIGHGSIGSRYKLELLKRNFKPENILIVDKSLDVLNSLKSEGFKCFNSIDQLSTCNNDIDYGIISNWGPDHFEAANFLLNNKCKRLIIEKPVTNSLSNLNNLIEKTKKLEAYITVHHRWKYLELADIIHAAQNEYQLGEPIGARFIGGALCISTGGIHWLDLACEVLNSEPKSILADLDIDYINPRDKTLAFIGGLVSYRLNNKKFIHVSYSNSNSQSPRTEFVYKHGLIEIDIRGKIKCWKRNEKDLDKFENVITRYGFFDSIGEITFENSDTISSVLDDLMYGTSPKVSLDRAKRSLSMLIGAIQSHLEGRRIDCSTIKDQDIRFS